MKLIDRLIGRAVLSGALMVLVVLVALLGVMDFVGELGDVGRGTYGVLQAMEYVGLTMPRRAYELLPMAALIGSLLGLGTLANNSELVVIRAAGVSLARVIASVLRVSVVLMLVGLVLGELIAPFTEQLAQDRRAAALTEEFSNRTKSGFWVRDGDSYINIRRILPGAQLVGVSIYKFDGDQRLRAATFARHGRYADGEWRLRDIHETLFDGDRARTVAIPQMIWSTTLDPQLVHIVSVEPEELSLWGLHQFIDYLRDNDLATRRYEIAFWVKAFSPLATLVMVFMALPFVFGSLRAVSIGQRILVGTFLGIALQVLSRSFGYLGQVYNLNPVFAAAFPTLLFLAIALVLMRRVR